MYLVRVWETMNSVKLSEVIESTISGRLRPSVIGSSSKNQLIVAGGRPSRDVHLAIIFSSISNTLPCLLEPMTSSSGRLGASIYAQKLIY